MVAVLFSDAIFEGRLGMHWLGTGDPHAQALMLERIGDIQIKREPK